MSTFLDMNNWTQLLHLPMLKKLFFYNFIKILNNTRTEIGNQPVCLLKFAEQSISTC